MESSDLISDIRSCLEGKYSKHEIDFVLNNLKEKSSDRWLIRRRLIYFTLIFCASLIAFIVLTGNDNDTLSSIASGLMILAGSTLSTYICGATFQDTWGKIK